MSATWGRMRNVGVPCTHPIEPGRTAPFGSHAAEARRSRHAHQHYRNISRADWRQPYYHNEHLPSYHPNLDTKQTWK
jgi:hypothetical protein